jgi:heat-inducible transcriptional repressor
MRSTSGPLDARSRAILQAVIDDYVSTASPVGSQALVERYSLGVSSATVRGVLADLESAGLLTHPHTSAGRIPTDAGYRTYVESIVELGAPPPAVEQLMIRHQFGQVEFASEQWFRLAATTLASMTRSAGLATAAKPVAARVRRIDLVAIQDRLASLILVLREGTIKQGLIALDLPVTQADLTRVANLLNDRLAELTAADIVAILPRLERALGGDAESRNLTRKIADRIIRTVAEFDALRVEEVYSDGLLNVMEAPEFAQSEKLRRVFTALENRAYLADLIAVTETGRIHVFIGRENAPAEMGEVSLVLAPYGQAGRAVGVVGVLGPTRMAYAQAIGTVGFISGLMNELVDHLYA